MLFWMPKSLRKIWATARYSDTRHPKPEEDMYIHIHGNLNSYAGKTAIEQTVQQENSRPAFVFFV